MPDSKPVQYRVVDRIAHAGGDERAAVVRDLMAPAARIAPKYFYDELGCALYAAICRLPEYYPPRVEAAIFAQHRDAIVEAAGSGGQLVDLGAGDCRKAQAWMPFLEPSRYVAVDIAATELEQALARMAPDFPDIEMLGVVTDFSVALPLEDMLDARAATFFYPGSSIGNFTPDEAVRFLARVRTHCVSRPGSGLLIGVDGKKEKARLDAAYDDALGVTAAFNRNVLRHLNRRFGFDFAPERYAHRGFYDEAHSRIEMHLEARGAHAVNLGAETRRFAKGERIHTENSYKYAPQEFERVLASAGFGSVRRWSSPDQGYFVFYAR